MLDPLDAAERFGPDPLRLYLTKEIVFGSDGDFTWDRFEEKYNVDLANNLGNLVNRVTAMAERYRAGHRCGRDVRRRRLRGTCGDVAQRYIAAMDRLCARRGLPRRVPPDRRDQRVHRVERAVGAGQAADATRRSTACCGRAPRRCASPPCC